MDSPAPINFQAHAGRVAQAYGAKSAVKSPAMRGAAQVGAFHATQSGQATIGPNGVIQPPFPVTRDPNGRGTAADVRRDRVTLTGPAQAPQPIEQLVAGQVDSPVSRGQGFDEPPSRTASAGSVAASGAYAMYTRSADRVEVATSVAIGRTLDARG